MLRQEDLRVDVGRCQGGSFIRVVHLPTGISRVKGPCGGESFYSIKVRFLDEIENELVALGLSQHIEPPLPERERLLLEDALDAHDRLWDQESSVADVWKLYAATAEALRGTPHHAAFEPAVAVLADLMRSRLPADEKWSRACGSTDDLRKYLARQLGCGGTGGVTHA
jgi:hypothetical protein